MKPPVVYTLPTSSPTDTEAATPSSSPAR
uniref:(California timema) hypothetical protein n=1 Tax=Timema californicum TaxID=61474 RepID=A0A7R9JMF0_TIMCA|nr:unnamed protein product [Timema californicum]